MVLSRSFAFPRPAARPAAAAALVALGLGAAPALAAPPAEQVELRYDITVAGISGLRVDVTGQVLPDRYEARTQIRNQGLLGALAGTYRAQNAATGYLAAGRAQPATADAVIQNKNKERRMAISYPGGGRIAISYSPPNTPKPGREVSEGQSNGSYDPLNAAIVALLGRDEPCAAPVPIYDGRKRFDLVPTARGTETLKGGGNAYAGPALRCDLTLRKIAGYKPDDQDDKDSWDDHPARIWLARLGDSQRYYPVRLEVDTALGTAVAVLSNRKFSPLATEPAARAQ